MSNRKKPVVIEAVRWRGYRSNLGITVESPDQPVESRSTKLIRFNEGP